MHDWLRNALVQVPLLHGGVRSIVERCATPGEAFWLYDVPELIGWVALARSAQRGIPEMYARSLASELSRAALGSTPNESSDGAAGDDPEALWRQSGAFSALAALAERASCFEPLDPLGAAHTQEHVFLSLQLADSLQGLYFLPLEYLPLAQEQSRALRDALEPLVGGWADPPEDAAERRARGIEAGMSARQHLGITRGSLDPADDDERMFGVWSDVLALAGAVEAPDLPVAALLPQLESLRDLLLVRCADFTAQGQAAQIARLVQQVRALVASGLEQPLIAARFALDGAGTAPLAELTHAAPLLHRCAAACALRSALAQAASIDRDVMTTSRALSVVRWSAELGERLETWCESDPDDRLLGRIRGVLRGPLDVGATIRPGE